MSEAENELQVAKQGDADGLCGIYCLINHMRNWELGSDEKSNKQEALRYLLQSAQVLGFLDPNRLVYGFEAFELRLIFNQVAKWLQKGTRAYHLELLGDISVLEACTKVFCITGGEVVLSEKGGGHWVLATKSGKSGLMVLDSDQLTDNSIPRKPTSMKRGHGLALLPIDSDLASKLSG